MMGECGMCGSVRSLQLHHPTGRAKPGAPYLDADLTVAICGQPCHTAEHVLLRTLGLEFPSGPALAHRLRRMGLTARRFGDARRSLSFAPRSAEGLADLLFEAAEELER